MKKLIFALCVCAGLCACSSDDDLVSSSSSEDLGQATAFLTVNLKDVNSSTRATDGGFAYGSTTEQVVNNAYFYFYDAQGNYMAKGNVGTTSGTASTSDSTGETADGNIEWESNTVVAIYGLDMQYGLPTQMLTIINQPSDVNLNGLSLTDAREKLAGTPYADASGNFVMSTVVYENGAAAAGQEIVSTTALTVEDFATEPTATTTDYPNGGVDVYVERLAAKVTVNDGLTYDTDQITVDGNDENEYSVVTITDNIPHIASSDIANIAVRLVGWDVNGTARDAYLSKKIEAWTGSEEWSTWNDATNGRCYWAESPNYGVAQDYPTSSNGNTDTEEEDASTWLNSYLKYTSLSSYNLFDDGYAYCGENTNTTAVLVDDSNTGITNLLVRAQALTEDNDGTWHGSDLVEYQGSLYTAADFCEHAIEDVIDYDFTALVDDVIAGLGEEYSSLAPYLEDIAAAIYHDAIYVSEAVNGHKVTAIPEGGVSKFDYKMLSLYNVKDGNVRMFYNGAQPYWGEDGDDTGTAVEPDLYAKYPASDIVYGGADLDDYEFYFHINYSELSSETQLGNILLQLILQDSDGNYYLPIDNRFSFESESWGVPGYSGGHTYTLRNFFLRAITVEADDIDTEFGSHYPNLYKNGYMYYSVPIEHLATNNAPNAIVEGEYGIVRNHWYDITVNSISGLGRGIAKDEEVIIPQPELTYYYLGADINILSWKHVQQTVNW